MVSLRQLRYLESQAETRHFGHAAEACAVSQPALSMQINELDDELQVRLGEIGLAWRKTSPRKGDFIQFARLLRDVAPGPGKQALK